MQISFRNPEGLQSNQRISVIASSLWHFIWILFFFASLLYFKNVIGFLLQSFSFAGLTLLISLSTSLPKVFQPRPESMGSLLDYSVFPQRSHFWKHTSSPDTTAKFFKTDIGERKARVTALKRILKIKQSRNFKLMTLRLTLYFV